MAVIITTDGQELPVTPANGQQFTTEEVRAAVRSQVPNDRGYVRKFDLTDGRKICANEDAVALNLPLNVKATTLYHGGRYRKNREVIAGDVLVCHSEGDSFTA